jgi:hypothetical protein
MELNKNLLDKYFGQFEWNLLAEFVGVMTEKTFILRDIGDISNRVIHNWIAEDLIPGFKVTSENKEGNKTDQKQRKWNRFSFVDYIWLRIIIELRKFDISFSLLHKIKNDLFSCIEVDDYIELIKNNIGEIEKIIPKEHMDEVHAMIANAVEKKEVFKIGFSKFNYLYILLGGVIIRKEATSLIIDNQGRVYPYAVAYAESLMDSPDFNEAILGHHICISLTKIVSEFISKSTELNDDVLRLKLLTNQEIKILNLIRTDNIKDLKIRYDNKSKPVMIELTTNDKVFLETRIIDVIYQKGYHSIVVETDAGNVVYCSNTRRIKL